MHKTMTFCFIWVVLWLNAGGITLTPEPHVVVAIDASCADDDFKATAYHEAVERSPHKDKIISADVWCDEVTAKDAPV